MRLDLVYLWVDGSDPKWLSRREKYLPDQHQRRAENHSDARYLDNDELRYSLRSVESYAPWINHIYIVTDNQTPQWLNTNHPKITIVDHTQMLPANVLPTYNSTVIELGVVNIEGLSEYFLLANDDTLLYRPVQPEMFLSKEGVMQCRIVNRQLRQSELSTTYGEQIKRVNRVISEQYDTKVLSYLPHHNINIFSKSVIKEVIKTYSKWHKKSLSNRFRTKRDMQHHLFTLYAIIKSRAEVVDVRKGVYTKVFKRLWDRASGVDSIVIPLPLTWFNRLRLRLYNPAMICINDNEKCASSDRRKATALLAHIFPKKSSFEL